MSLITQLSCHANPSNMMFFNFAMFKLHYRPPFKLPPKEFAIFTRRREKNISVRRAGVRCERGINSVRSWRGLAWRGERRGTGGREAARVPGGLFASPSGYQLACSSRSTAAIVRRIVSGPHGGSEFLILNKIA